jgi:uncharacterized repeat protein (TIGR01451 family)
MYGTIPCLFPKGVTGQFLTTWAVTGMDKNNFFAAVSRNLMAGRRQPVVWLLLAAVGLSPLQVLASEATQCANTKRDADPDTCEEWINGNLGQSKASYVEGESIAYRAVLEPVQAGHEYELTIGWDAVVSDKNALDYLTSYDYTVANADPCSAGDLCNLASPDHTVAIPPDLVMQNGRDGVTGGGDDVTQVSGEFVVWGGEIVSISDYTYPAGFDYFGSEEITLTLRIRAKAGASRVVFAWGGHIASRLDWGNVNGVVNLNGSPYHMRLSGDEYDAQGTYIGTISGIQGDLSLASGAVVFPAYLNITKEADRSTGDDFLFRTNAAADVVTDGSFSLKHNESLQLRVEGNSRAYVEEDLSQLLDIYGEPLWEVLEVFCTDNDDETLEDYWSVTGNRLDISMGEALEVDCYFKNEFKGLPKLELAKKVIPADASCDAVDFDLAGNESLDVASGDTVRYCYRIRNTGNDIAFDLALTDDAGTAADMADDFGVTLAGGDLAELGKDGAVTDLGVAGNTFGEATVQIALPVGSTVTNTASASGIDAIDQPIIDTDTATVNVTNAQACTLSAGVSTTGSCDDAGSVAYVIEGTPLTWCAGTCLQDGNSGLINATIALQNGETMLQGATGQTLGAGSCKTWTFDETAGSSIHERTLTADGVDDYANAISCRDDATAEVFDPNIEVTKLVSLDSRCGNADDTKELTVYYGTPVWYCLSVENKGDEGLVNVNLSDPLLGLDIDLPDLAVNSKAWESGAYSYGAVTGDIHNRATANADGDMTGQRVSHAAAADVHMQFADIRVAKTGTAKLNAKLNQTAVDYSITVSNIGNVTAVGVMLTDTLPDLIDYLSDDAGCAYDAMQHALTCDLGDIAPGSAGAVTLNITGQLVDPAPVFGSFENLACAEVTAVATPDIDTGNNCDTHHTRIVPGATRTIGFWQNHPDMLDRCLTEPEENRVSVLLATDAASCENPVRVLTEVDGIDLGYVQIADEVCDNDLDATVSTEVTGNGNGNSKSLADPVSESDADLDAETALEAALGVLKASPAHWTDGTKRSDLDQARTIAGRQVLATICNVSLFDALRPGFLDDYLGVLSGGDIDAIMDLSADADSFNNSGDNEPIGPHSSADPGANSDDPTDPSD